MSEKMQQALHVVERYYQQVVNDLADGILEHEHSFGTGYLDKGESVIETYAHRLFAIERVVHHLTHAARPAAPPAAPEVSVDQFRCATEEAAGRLQQWLRDHPEAHVLHFLAVPIPEGVLGLVVHRPSAPTACESAD